MNDLIEMQKLQIEALQKELAKKTTLISNLRNLINEFENEIKTEKFDWSNNSYDSKNFLNTARGLL